MSSSLARRILFGLTLGVLLALILAPQTRWLVRNQTDLVLHIQPNPRDYAARVQALAARHPHNFQIQFVNALQNIHPVSALRALEAQFPNNAALRANVLRYACVKELRENRPENYLLDQEVIPPGANFLPETTPAQFTAFIQDAIIGERLDPSNAYFPFISAACYYAEHDDAAARAALLQAGTKPDWNEYIVDDVQAQWNTHQLVYGRSSAIARSEIVANELFPEYADLRAVARMATYQALVMEQAGNAVQGIALRQALIHCGGLMRAKSPTLICSLVGIAIDYVAMLRPGGAPRLQSPLSTFHQAVVSDYVVYLHRYNETELGRQVLAEAQADQQTEKMLTYNPSLIKVYLSPLLVLCHWWIVGLLLLSNVLWLIFLRGLAWLQQYFTLYLKAQHREYNLRAIVSAIIFGSVIIVLGNVFILFAGKTAEAADSYWQKTNYMLTGNMVQLPQSASLIFTVLTLALPLILILVSLICLRRAPFTQTIAAASVPLACLTLLVYAGVVMGTLRQERVANHTLQNRLHGEGPYIAQQNGQTWPGVVQ